MPLLSKFRPEGGGKDLSGVRGLHVLRAPACAPGKACVPEPPARGRRGGCVSLEMPRAPGDEPDLLSIMCSVCLYCVFPGRVAQGARVHQHPRGRAGAQSEALFGTFLLLSSGFNW